MNHIYRIVWNHSTACWQAVSEVGKGKHKVKANKSAASSGNNMQIFAKMRPVALLVSLFSWSLVMAAPMGGQVSAGQAIIQQQGAVTHIHQSSQNAAINWQDFSVRTNEVVNFHQPNSDAITLNRVVGNEVSNIQGAVNANGHVFISNPNGVLIGKNASINVGGFVATTQKISDDDVILGRLQFDGKATGKVENLGTIKVPKGGMVALIAPIVKNQGKIEAPEGKVLLASAEAFRISLPNDNFSYTLNRGTLQGLVDNGGAIIADGGRVVLTAKGVSAVKKSVVKHSGIIQANTVKKTKGAVELLGDLDNSELDFLGKITAEAPNGGDGGFVETSAAKLKISDSAKVSTLAKDGKTGKWVIDPKEFTVAATGGDMTGQQVSNALNSSDVELKSRDGANEGKGDVIINDVIEWSNNLLILNAENDIHINKTLNGLGVAKLMMKYGQGSFSGDNSDYFIQKLTPLPDRTAKIYLPEGKNFILKKGADGDEIVYDVIHHMPEINADGSTADFLSRYIALGKDIDLNYTRDKPGFLGWGVPAPGEYGGSYLTLSHFEGLGHKLSNLIINSEPLTNQEYEALPKDKFGRPKNYVEVGLFRCLCDENRPSKISNLIVKNANVWAGSHWFVGGIVGEGSNLTIKDTYLDLGNIFGRQQVGAIAGVLTEGGVLDNVYSAWTVLTGSHFTGGLIGEVDGKVEKGGSIIRIKNSVVERATVSGSHAGGLVGLAKDVEMTNVGTNMLKMPNEGNNIGGLIGTAYNTTLTNGRFQGEITQGGSHVGGLIGLSGENYKKPLSYTPTSPEEIWRTANQPKNVMIRNSTAYGSVVGKDRVGGLVGLGVLTEIIDSSGFAAVEGRGYSTAIGGLIGSADFTTIQSSQALAPVTGDENVGGLAGEFFGSHIEHSLFDGTVTAKQRVAGGLVGASTGSTVSESHIKGDITAPEYSGTAVGLVKRREHARESYVFKNSGNVTSSSGLEIGGYDSEDIGEPPVNLNPDISVPSITLPPADVLANPAGGHIGIRPPVNMPEGTRLVITIINADTKQKETIILRRVGSEWHSSNTHILPNMRSTDGYTTIGKGKIPEGSLVSVVTQNDNNEMSETAFVNMPGHKPITILDLEAGDIRQAQLFIHEAKAQRDNAQRVLNNAQADGIITAAERNNIIEANRRISEKKTKALDYANGLTTSLTKSNLLNQINRISLVNVPNVTPRKPVAVAEPKPPVAQPKPPVAQPKPPVAQPKPPVAQPKPPVAQPKPPVAELKPPVVQPKPPVVQPKPPVAQPKPPVAQPKPPVAELKPPVVQPKPPVAQPKPPVTQPRPEKEEPPKTIVAPINPLKISPVDHNLIEIKKYLKHDGTSLIDQISNLPTDVTAYPSLYLDIFGNYFSSLGNSLLENSIKNIEDSSRQTRFVNLNNHNKIKQWDLNSRELELVESFLHSSTDEVLGFLNLNKDSEEYITSTATFIAIGAAEYNPYGIEGVDFVTENLNDLKLALGFANKIASGIKDGIVDITKDFIQEKLSQEIYDVLYDKKMDYPAFSRDVNNLNMILNDTITNVLYGYDLDTHNVSSKYPRHLFPKTDKPRDPKAQLSKEDKDYFKELVKFRLGESKWYSVFNTKKNRLGDKYRKVIDKANSLEELAKGFAELNTNTGIALIAAQRRQQREKLDDFMRKASNTDKLKYIAQQKFLRDNPNIDLKGKYIFVINRKNKLERVKVY